MNRTKERQIAFEIIFSFPFHKENDVNEIMEFYFAHDTEMGTTEYIKNTVNGVFENIEKIDELIKNNIKHRRFERLDNVCLAVMRLAVYEMLFNDDIPVSVAINEAIELIKNYDDSLSAFVHGNLAIIAKCE